MVLYEGYGPACIYRIFLYPSLPTNSEVLHKMTSSNLSAMFLEIEFDSQLVLRFSLQNLAEANEWPFVRPLSTKHPLLVSEIGANIPFCYQKSLRIVYRIDRDFPANLLDLKCCAGGLQSIPHRVNSSQSTHNRVTK